MTKIYVVRHGEAEGNLFARSHGTYNGRLTALGRRQACSVAKRLKDVPFTAAYSSYLYRARDTALAILEYHPGVKLRLTTRLREVSTGIWEDHNWGELERKWPVMMENYHHNLEEWDVEGCEKFSDARMRAIGFINEVAKKHQGETVLCTCHGYVIKAIVSEINGISSRDSDKVAFSGNTAVTILNVDDCGNITIELESDSSHLDIPDEKGPLKRKTTNGKHGGVEVKNFDLDSDAEFYHKWNPNGDIEKAKAKQAIDARAVGMIELQGEKMGMIELDIEKDKNLGKGWIDYYFIDEDKRGTGFSKALIGHALSVYRDLLRDYVTIAVDEDNESLSGYLEHYFFEKTGTVTVDGKNLNILEYDLII